MQPLHRKIKTKFSFLDFFSGSGLVTAALPPYFQSIWANDICEKKAVIYKANHGDKHLHVKDICEISGTELPSAELSWASFPCQDLSLAGSNGGIHAKRSGLVWEWLRIMDEMPTQPSILVAENVVGLISQKKGEYYHTLHEAFRERGYVAGAIILDAVRWVPQSRPRVFIIAVKKDAKIPSFLTSKTGNWLHPKSIMHAAHKLEDWIWWYMPEPPERLISLEDIVDWDADCDEETTCNKNISLIPNSHWDKFISGYNVAAGYKRTRNGKQVLELRFDGNAGCLRTPRGGSSRQYLVLRKGRQFKTRLLTIRETARLMGAPENYHLPGSYNDGYRAMGDAVAAPVAHYLAQYLLAPLAEAIKEQQERQEHFNVG